VCNACTEDGAMQTQHTHTHTHTHTCTPTWNEGLVAPSLCSTIKEWQTQMLSQKSAVWNPNTVSSMSAAHRGHHCTHCRIERITIEHIVHIDVTARERTTTVLRTQHQQHCLLSLDVRLSPEAQMVKSRGGGGSGTFVLCRIMSIMVCIMCMSVTICATSPHSAGLGCWCWRWPHITQIHFLQHLFMCRKQESAKATSKFTC